MIFLKSQSRLKQMNVCRHFNVLNSIFLKSLFIVSDENTTASPSLSPVLQTAGDNVTLDCSLADQDEQVEGTVWKKEDLFLVSDCDMVTAYIQIQIHIYSHNFLCCF